MRTWLNAALAVLMILLLQPPAAVAAASASPAGLWQTFDDRSGRPSGQLRIYESDGVYFARIERGGSPDDATRVCAACTAERRNQPLVGLVIMRNMRLQNGEYGGGDILDPRSGSVYPCSFHLAGGGSQLVIRGYIGIPLFGRSQTWTRVE